MVLLSSLAGESHTRRTREAEKFPELSPTCYMYLGIKRDRSLEKFFRGGCRVGAEFGRCCHSVTPSIDNDNDNDNDNDIPD